jgi:hypothetical protein
LAWGEKIENFFNIYVEQQHGEYAPSFFKAVGSSYNVLRD